MHWLGQRSCRDQLVLTRGQIAQECPVATEFGRTNPWPVCSAFMGSKVLQGSTEVNQGSNCPGMPCGNQIWWEEPLTGVNGIYGVKGHAGVNLLSNALWQPNLVERTPDRCVVHLWGQRSCSGSTGLNQGLPEVKLLRNALWQPNLIGGTPDQSVVHWVHWWGQIACRGQPGVKLFRNALWLPNLIRRN